MADSEGDGSGQGPAVDRNANPVRDPTENVKDLNAAQDRLREKESEHVREILSLRSDTAEKISSLNQQLIDEKFAGRDRIAAIKESHRLELKGDGEKQLTAALAAAEKARVEENKSNQLTTDRSVIGMKELITNNAEISKAQNGALVDKVEDLRVQVSALIQQKIGATEQRAEQRTVVQEKQAISGATVALITLGFFILSILVGILITLIR